MADVVLDPNCTNYNELYGKGIRAYALQDYDAAVLAFSKASEILVKQNNNDDLHDSLGEVYLYYGKSLLNLFRKQSNPLGENIIPEEEEDDDDDDDHEDGGENNENVEEETEQNKNNEGNNETESKETEKEKPKEVEEEKKESKETEKEKHKEKERKESKETEKEKPKEESEKETKEEKKAENVKESEEIAEQEEGEDCSDLQVAWEVLELAKTIFTKRGEEGKKLLAETMIILGEISLESNMFDEGIFDMTKGLEIQKTLYGNDSRIVAETYYKIAMTLCLLNKHQEAINSYNKCIEYLKNHLKNIENDPENNIDEIKEITALIPEIEEKIADAYNFKEELAKEIQSVIKGGKQEKSTNGGVGSKDGSSSSSSTSTKVNDITHLVKRKRKIEEPADESVNPPKKPSI